MKLKFAEVPGAVVAPQGFLTSGVFCDIKRLGTGKGSNKGKKRGPRRVPGYGPVLASISPMFGKLFKERKTRKNKGVKRGRGWAPGRMAAG